MEAEASEINESAGCRNLCPGVERGQVTWSLLCPKPATALGYDILESPLFSTLAQLLGLPASEAVLEA